MEAKLNQSRALWWLSWALLLGVVAAIYAPGLYGSFVFDDDVNILQNSNLRIGSLSFTNLWAAALSGEAGPLGRPIALLTFALNMFWGGANPFYFKLVNLIIHLSNAILVGSLVNCLCAELQLGEKLEEAQRSDVKWMGWMVAALWALHPINLTGVLYVVQRMTSLSTFFGLFALLVYSRYRARTYFRTSTDRPKFDALMHGAFVIFLLALSVLTKESGLLFAPLLLWIEYYIFRFRFGGAPIRLMNVKLRTHVTILGMTACAYVVIFKIPAMVSPESFSNRDFGLRERVLTETRVIFYYLGLIFLPENSKLSLYHDDFEISRSLWEPITTIFSIAGVLIVTGTSWALRKLFPAFLFGWVWFLISHTLESTIFALELVHEHRNYFATVGLFFMFPLAILKTDDRNLRRVFKGMLIGYIVLMGFVTHVRALQWSNAVDWAALEASNHPRSARANYEMARTYMILMHNTKDAQFGELADQALKRATESYLPGMLPYLARVQLSYYRGLQPDLSMVDAIKYGLRNRPYYTVNTAALNSFVTCQIEEKCTLPNPQVLELLEAALENSLIPKREAAEVRKLQAQYYINRYHDLNKGTELIEQSIAINDQPSSRIMYAQALAMRGDFVRAMAQLDRAEAADGRTVYRQQIERERVNFRQASRHQ